ncbi:MAG: lipid-A-disaccharide synthase [Chitinophagaceae bacterium]
MKYYIIAGEASGDLHGSSLIKELRKIDKEADIRCWGGDMMEAAGAVLVKHYRELAFMGFTEVIRNLATILDNLKRCKEDILAFKPDTLLLIDYPGFNLRMARWAKQQHCKVIYYISPQVWAWKESRVKSIKQTVDKMIVILPFEKDFYNKWDYQVDYVGHPLVEIVDKWLITVDRRMLSNKPIIALLPGSRKQEILKKLPIMLEVCRLFPLHQFIVAKAPGQDDEFYEELLGKYDNVSSVRNETYNLLLQSSAALVTSGTATLETALFGVPEVVCYKGSLVSYWIAKRLIKVKYISLVNLIMDKQVVKELIQEQLTVENLQKELNLLLYDPSAKADLKKHYGNLKKLLSKGGNASANAAKIIVQFLRGDQ